MSLIRMSFFSDALNMYTGANVILPLPRYSDTDVSDLPVLILLHGMGDDFTAWQRKTSVERYALEHGIAVIMPDGGLSCYENMAHGATYADYIGSELMQIMGKIFPLTRNPTKTHIAGCSMGGCGALKLALKNPENYASVGCFSASHLEYRPNQRRNQAMIRLAFGDQLEKRDAEITADAIAAAKGSHPLKIWHGCGDQDILKEAALEAKAFLENLGGSIDYHFEMMPGKHDWALWDEMLKHYLATLNLPEPEVHLL